MEKRQCREGGGSCVHFSSQTKNTACLLWMHCKRVGCHCAHAHAHAGTHTHQTLGARKPARLLCPQYSPVKNTGVGCHALLQGIFLSQGLLRLLHWQAGSSPLAPPEETSPSKALFKIHLNQAKSFRNFHKLHLSCLFKTGADSNDLVMNTLPGVHNHRSYDSLGS